MGHTPLRVADLVADARRLSDHEFELALGEPLALLVGPGSGTDSGERAVMTRQTPILERRMEAWEFARQEVYPVRAPREPARSDAGSIRIGRGPTNDVVILDASISTTHMTLTPAPGGFRVSDCGSLNGTMVAGALVLPGQEVTVRLGDTLQLGSRLFKIYGPLQLRRIVRALVI